jgi:multiple sugar transport system permease protein
VVNSTLIATFATLLALVLGTPAAYALARFRFELVHKRDLAIFFFSQRVLPPVATVIPFYLVMRTLGLLDTHLALVLVNATFILPFVVVILRQGFLDLPIELEESALVDGADHGGAFWRVALPLAAPVIAATGLIIFGRAWNEFLFALAIAGKGAITIPVHMAGTAGTRGVQFWYLAVRQMIAIIPPVLIALIAQRYIIRGPDARRRQGLRARSDSAARQRAPDGFRLAIDHPEEGAGGPRRVPMLLLPILHGPCADAEVTCKYFLRHADLPADRLDVDVLAHMHTILARISLAFGEGQRFAGALDHPTACA